MSLPSHADLESVIESDRSSGFCEFAAHLAAACIDWPKYGLVEPGDLLCELAGEMSGALTRAGIEQFLMRLPRSGSENWAHKAEACVAILELFRISGEERNVLTLDDLIRVQWKEYRDRSH